MTMKKIKIFAMLTLAACLFSITSCKEFIDEELNIDPNNPEDVSMNVLLSGAEVTLAFSYASDLTRYPALWTQTLSGIANQHLLFDNYILTESDVNNMWYYNLYGGAMSDLSILMKKAVEQNSPHYGGVAKILMASALGVCTDLWGDIPYSQAFQGLANMKPAYDSQQQIYTTIQSLLDQAIVDLSASTSNFYPGADDFIYGGDLAAWTAFAYSLKARNYLHLGKRDAANYQLALNQIPNAISGNSGSAVLNFGSLATENNPIYKFYFEDRPGDAGVGKTLVDLMNSLNDPRRAVYFTTDANCTPDTCYSGSPAGAGDAATSYMGSFYGSPTSPSYFLTYAEIKFIEAECEFRVGSLANAAAAFNDAVAASLDMFGTPDAAYLAANASEVDTTITIDKIFTQKYIHMYCQGTEGFTDWRRSHDSSHPNGIPALSPAVANTTNGVIARRFPYPNSERLQNGTNLNAAISNQGGADVTNRVWWDL
jgi:hypothetical protein